MSEDAVHTDRNRAHVYRQSPFKREWKNCPAWVARFAWVYVTVLGIFALVVIWGISSDSEGSARIIMPLVAVLCFLPAGLLTFHPWLRRTLCYEIRDDALVIVRPWPFKVVVVPSDVMEVVTRPSSRWETMTWRNEGSYIPAKLDSWIIDLSAREGFLSLRQGCFEYSASHRGFALYSAVTDPHRLVLIECKDRVYLISPEHPDEFVRDIRVMI